MMYNYLEQMIEDVKQAIEDNYNAADYSDRDELEQVLNDDLWTDDSVTGSGSGSYTFNSYRAKEYVLDNIDLLKDAYTEFCEKERFADDFFAERWEDMDITIRCYLLGQAISEALDEIEDDLIFADDILDEDEPDNDPDGTAQEVA